MAHHTRLFAACLMTAVCASPAFAQGKDTKVVPKDPAVVKKEAAAKEAAKPVKPQPGSTPQPRATNGALSFDKVFHDFGTIPDTNSVSTVFRFTNVTNKPIRIKSVTAGCGCTTPRLSKLLYQPGESGEINVSFNPARRRGDQTKNVKVRFDTAGLTDQSVEITSYVSPLVMMDPLKSNLSSVERGVGATTTMYVSGQRENFKILSVDTKDPLVTYKIGPAEQVEDWGAKYTRYRIDLTVSPQAPMGRIVAGVDVVTNEQTMPTLTHNMIAQVYGDLRASPDRLGVRLRSYEEPFTQQINLDSIKQGVTFNVTGIKLGGDADLGLVADVKKISKAGKDTYQIIVSGTGPAIAGPFRGTVTILTDLKDSEELQVPIAGVVIRPRGTAGNSTGSVTRSKNGNQVKYNDKK